MNNIEIFKAQENILKEKYEGCRARLEALAAECTTEKKALNIELGMYKMCLRAGFYDCGADAEKALEGRSKVICRIIEKYPAIGARFGAIAEAEKPLFVAAVQAELFIRDQIYGTFLAEMRAAKEANDAESVFELQIKTGAMKSVFAAWEIWRKETGIYPNVFGAV